MKLVSLQESLDYDRYSKINLHVVNAVHSCFVSVNKIINNLNCIY